MLVRVMPNYTRRQSYLYTIVRTPCTVATVTVVRAMARHRWRHSQYVGLTRVQLEHSRRRADREHQRQAREQAERRSEEVVRMAQEHYFPWRPEW